MNQLLFFSSIISILEVATPCSIGACLTWYGSSELITLRCRVDRLKWRVTFFNQYGNAQASCIAPFPKPYCRHYYRNGTIYQDIHTNITVLKIKGHIDSNINGKWKCEHGTNTDTAIVNVTVIREVRVDVDANQGNCTIEIIAATVITVVVVTCISMIVRYLLWKRKKGWCPSNNRNSRDCDDELDL